MLNVKLAKQSASSAQNIVAIKEIRDGVVVLKNGSFRAVLSATSINFELLSEDERSAATFGYQGFLNSLDFPIQILVHSRKLNITPYLSSLADMEKKQRNELLKIQTSEYRDFVENLVELQNIMNKSFYVVVPFGKLESKRKSILETAKDFLKVRTSTDISKESFEETKNQIMQRTRHIQIGLQGFGIRSVPLNTEELIELYYELYNPEASVTGNVARVAQENN